MKRSDMVQELAEYIIGNIMIGDNWTVAKKEANKILGLIELNGMLPPKRSDASPTGYGAAYLSEENVMKNYFNFKHSWEEE